MIDFQRYLLIAAIAALSFMLLIEWKNFEPAIAPTEVASSQVKSAPSATILENADGDLPSVAAANTMTELAESASAASRIITASSDVLDIKIDLLGGDIVYVGLPKHSVEINSENPFVLLEDNDKRSYIAQSGLIGANATDTAEGRPTFISAKSNYALADDQESMNIDLHYKYSESINIIKRLQLTRGDYLIRVDYLIDNQSDENFQARFFGQLKRDNSEDPGVDDGGGMFAMKPFMGVAYANNEDLYSKLSFDKMRDKPLKEKVNGGWIGIIQHYFLNAWVPDSAIENQISTVVSKQGFNIARVTSAAVIVAPKSSGKISASLYSGPKDQYRLEEVAPGLDLTVDYGWLWWIAQPIFWLLTKIHSVLGNWGFSIIAVTMLVKAAFFQLNAKAFTSMANMRKVQPKLLALRERHADDKQKQSQAMMELYKTEKINPLGGCLPMLVQMPVFISLYWVLMESVELRHAPFILWIHDLAAMDPYFILPLIMGLSMFIQQRLNPPPPDPMQAKIMQWMPVMFTFFFLFFPAGLVLYWVVNNTLSIIQQYIITKRIEKSTA